MSFLESVRKTPAGNSLESFQAHADRPVRPRFGPTSPYAIGMPAGQLNFGTRHNLQCAKYLQSLDGVCAAKSERLDLHQGSETLLLAAK